MLNFVLIIVRSALFLVDICNSYIRLLIERFIAKRVLSRFFSFSETMKTETKKEKKKKGKGRKDTLAPSTFVRWIVVFRF